MAANPRTFDYSPAARAPTPLLFGIAGPSGSGKTFSALRLATGMQRVIGGDIALIDTEHDRALHYAELFKFHHVPFRPPFSPLDYIAAIEHCAKQDAGIIIIDSMSHEHEGQGGLLEWHDAEVERMVKGPGNWNAQSANIPAWNKPKAARRKLINAIIQSNANFILCFRAKDKIKIGKGKVIQLGFMPIAGEEYVYELTAKSLLLPGAEGVPTLQSDQPGESMMIKLPAQFRSIFSGAAGKPLDEDIGEQMAQWAAGAQPEGRDTLIALLDDYAACTTDAQYTTLEKRRQAMWETLAATSKKQAKQASDDAADRLLEALSEREAGA